jgi:DNA repair protein SbcC/Rad50
MIPKLKQITVQNFRCISGKATIPLEATVVLIHGPNGTGKTSVLSAIELALTGQVSALQRLDDDYLSHIVHRNSDYSEITLSAYGLDSEQVQTTTLTVQNNEVHGEPLLDKAMGHVFTERCNLAQSTLGRLLEIYQYESAKGDSQLTRFVKDLLSLDRLEALIDGLDSAGDIRNTRKLAPKYKDVEDRRNNLSKVDQKERQRLLDTQSEARTLKVKLIDQLAALPRPSSLPPTDQSADLQQFFTGELEGEKLVVLSQQRREFAAMQAEWRLLAETENSTERLAAEASDRDATSLAREWRDTAGKELERILDELRKTFPDLPSAASTDPELARFTALQLATAEARRCDELISQSDAVTNEIGTLEQAILRDQSRIRLLDDQISAIAGDSESLSRSLAALIPHIKDEDCPVCGRDFGEVSQEPLVSHLSSRIAHLTEQTGRLQALTAEKTDVVTRISETERDLNNAQKKQISQDERVSLKGRAAHLAEAARKLTELSTQTVKGLEILRTEATERKRLAELRIRDQRATEVRAAIAAFCEKLGEPPIGKADSLDKAISRMENYFSAEEIRLKEIQSFRQNALIEYRRLFEMEKEIDAMSTAVDARAKVLNSVEAAFETSEKRRLHAKNIASAARNVRSAIVSRVFNDSLNMVWRDLFVRLAPSEPFVPAFKVPESDRAVMAILETVHRDGGHGGTPGAMLSSGNLNTAALTLFLALHLSAKAALPWLILDDPVQSMDEVHITQFAALLRTISKRHGRQIVMAVHDRPLFEYLALELSPAFQSDQLITVELSQTYAGVTIAEPDFRYWKPDSVVA